MDRRGWTGQLPAHGSAQTHSLSCCTCPCPVTCVMQNGDTGPCSPLCTRGVGRGPAEDAPEPPAALRMEPELPHGPGLSPAAAPGPSCPSETTARPHLGSWASAAPSAGCVSPGLTRSVALCPSEAGTPGPRGACFALRGSTSFRCSPCVGLSPRCGPQGRSTGSREATKVRGPEPVSGALVNRSLGEHLSCAQVGASSRGPPGSGHRPVGWQHGTPSLMTRRWHPGS